MYLANDAALKLEELGFSKTYYENEIAPFDFYEYDKQEWVIGGCVVPYGNLLAPNHIYEQGTWLPSLCDLMYWLADKGYTYTLECKERGHGFVVRVTDSSGKIIKGKGGTAEYALFKAIEQILG
ncbi:hypothetical protein [Cohnella phaseoli]|uniref:Phage ABA sandwich domain-containing protein n=1 Tax=Cohnella phaseoli TaxID=456490 RepID=A0A3D9I4P3_9BACL|nr:hypothetical protein [Cohnella phaseoli]RED56529.1 hypothetical protein DFP98_13987 [Cohnella phaseoli]